MEQLYIVIAKRADLVCDQMRCKYDTTKMFPWTITDGPARISVDGSESNFNIMGALHISLLSWLY